MSPETRARRSRRSLIAFVGLAVLFGAAIPTGFAVASWFAGIGSAPPAPSVSDGVESGSTLGTDDDGAPAEGMDSTDTAAAPKTPAPASNSRPEDYPDLIVRELRRRAAEPRPVPRSALPPRFLDAELFPDILVPRDSIVSGGPPPDGIASIDDPSFADVEVASSELAFDEPVLLFQLGAVERVYPVRYMLWHEIVNDVVGGVPVTITYCPLCNSAVAVDRRLEDLVLDFGTSGALHRSAMVMYDRQTESLWTHFDGRAVVGDLVGSELQRLPVQTVAWSTVVDDHPGASVLAAPSGAHPYGRSPYPSYEDRESPIQAWFRGELDVRLPAMDRVVGLSGVSDRVAVTWERVRSDGLVETDLDGRRVWVAHREGVRSPLSGERLDEGTEVGSAGAFFAEEDFTLVDGRLLDAATGSEWAPTGRAVRGARSGEQLEQAVQVDTFWFAWSAYEPDARLIAS